MNKEFEYHNIKFKPICIFPKNQEKINLLTKDLNYYEWFNTDKYNYSDFYKKAEEIGAKENEIFEVINGPLKGIAVVPCNNYLAILKEEKEKIINENFYKIEVAKKYIQLYEELYSSKTSLFRENPIAQIYWDNKKGYEFEILVNFENKSIIFKVDTLEFETIKFNNFYSLYEWLKDKNIAYFEQKYNDKFIVNQIICNILIGKTILSNLDEKDQSIYILFLYKYILYYIYIEEYIVALKIKEYGIESIKIQNRDNKDILLDIKNDILTKINQEMNCCLFENE